MIYMMLALVSWPISGLAASEIVVPRDFTTIQAAVDAAPLGARIKLRRGTYTEEWLKAFSLGFIFIGDCDFVEDHHNEDRIERSLNRTSHRIVPLRKPDRREAPIFGCSTGAPSRSRRFKSRSVCKNSTLHWHGIQERLQDEASILGVSDNSGQSVGRLVGLEF
jgi:hypothetical protein